MNTRITKALLGAAALVCGSTVGCGYRDFVDVSYPERYEYEDRQCVCAYLTTQAQNGHILDQTIWNIYFEPGTDRLTAPGINQLSALGRRRPMPDVVVYLQTANDIAVDPANLPAMVKARVELDMARKKSVESFMLAQTGLQFQVIMPHDPTVPYLFGQEGATAVREIAGSAKGIMTSTQGASSSGGGGASSGSSGGGGTSGGGR